MTCEYCGSRSGGDEMGACPYCTDDSHDENKARTPTREQGTRATTNPSRALNLSSRPGLLALVAVLIAIVLSATVSGVGNGAIELAKLSGALVIPVFVGAYAIQAIVSAARSTPSTAGSATTSVPGRRRISVRALTLGSLAVGACAGSVIVMTMWPRHYRLDLKSAELNETDEEAVLTLTQVVVAAAVKREGAGPPMAVGTLIGKDGKSVAREKSPAPSLSYSRGMVCVGAIVTADSVKNAEALDHFRRTIRAYSEVYTNTINHREYSLQDFDVALSEGEIVGDTKVTPGAPARITTLVVVPTVVAVSTNPKPFVGHKSQEEFEREVGERLDAHSNK